jgi:hypothetical protein
MKKPEFLPEWKLSFLRTGAVFLSVNLMEGSVGSK